MAKATTESPAVTVRTAFVPSPTVASHKLDGDTILFDRNNGRVFVLNETAAFAWNAVGHGLDDREIALEMTQRTGIESGRALADCRALIEQWRNTGLGTTGCAPANGVVYSDAAAAEPPPAPANELTFEPTDWPRVQRGVDERRRYRIADLRLNLDAPGEAFELIGGLLDHCRLPGGFAIDASEIASADDASATLTLAKCDRKWVLFFEDIPLTDCDDDAKLAPMIHATALHLAYAASQSLLSIHGAAVFAGERCIVFPGSPGAGKSTLTAALVAAGFGYCADDFLLLDGRPLRLRGIPLCIGLKEGAWPLLEDSIPAVGSLESHLREDDQLVRYLPPPGRAIASPEDRFQAAAIVFPRVVANERCSLDKMSRSAALLRIAEAGYHLLGQLDVAAFEAILAWLQSLDCYELRYSALDEAVDAVGSLLKPVAKKNAHSGLLHGNRNGV